MCLLSIREGVLLLDGQKLEAECLGCILIFLHGPVAIFIIQAGPVVVNVLIQLDVANDQVGEAEGEAFHDSIAKDLVEKKEDKESEEWPSRGLVELSIRPDFVVGVLADIWSNHTLLRRQMKVREHLLVGGHPVAEAEVDKRGV